MRMRLSDAIALGRVLIGRIDPHSFCGCAMAMGLLGVGKEPGPAILPALENDLVSHMASKVWRISETQEWPWIEEEYEIPEVLLDGEDRGHHFTNPAIDIISDLFFAVVSNELTLDQLIDWVRSNEPAEAVEVHAEEKTIAELAPSLVTQG